MEAKSWQYFITYQGVLSFRFKIGFTFIEGKIGFTFTRRDFFFYFLYALELKVAES